MRVLFLVPLLGLTLGPRTVVSNTITSYTVTEVEEDTSATDAGEGDVGVWPGNSDVVDEDGRPLVHSDAYAVGKGIQALFRYCIEAITGAAPEAGTDADGGAAGLVGDGEAMNLAATAAAGVGLGEQHTEAAGRALTEKGQK